jgi:alpha-N-arabinofuranosidase
MASLAQLVNVIAPIFTEAGGGVIRQTIFWPFAMVANVAKGSALRHFIPAGTFSSKYGDARRIQSAVVHNAAAGKLYLFALNSDFHDSFTLDPDLSAFGQTRLAEHQILRCDDLYAKNTFDRRIALRRRRSRPPTSPCRRCRGTASPSTSCNGFYMLILRPDLSLNPGRKPWQKQC